MPPNNNSIQATGLSVPSSLDEVDSDIASMVPDKAFSISIDLNRLKNLDSKVMLESSLVQWIATRWRSTIQPDSFRILHPERETADQLVQQLVSSAPGAVLAMLPAGKVQGIDRQTAAAFRQQFFTLQNQWPDLALFHSAFLVCVDAWRIQG